MGEIDATDAETVCLYVCLSFNVHAIFFADESAFSYDSP